MNLLSILYLVPYYREPNHLSLDASVCWEGPWRPWFATHCLVLWLPVQPFCSSPSGTMDWAGVAFASSWTLFESLVYGKRVEVATLRIQWSAPIAQQLSAILTREALKVLKALLALQAKLFVLAGSLPRFKQQVEATQSWRRWSCLWSALVPSELPGR